MNGVYSPPGVSSIMGVPYEKNQLRQYAAATEISSQEAGGDLLPKNIQDFLVDFGGILDI